MRKLKGEQVRQGKVKKEAMNQPNLLVNGGFVENLIRKTHYKMVFLSLRVCGGGVL